MELLSQETRHQIVQFVLGHPAHLASAAELHHMIGKSQKSVSDQLARLIDEDVLAEYVHEQNERVRDLPHQFYGPSERGITILDEFGYLDGVPMARAVYDRTTKSERVERHQAAPRPALPETVREALAGDGD